MNKTYNIQDFINQADENGFVELKIFCQKCFGFSANVIATYFDKEDRFYYDERVVKVRENNRNNITFITKPLKQVNPNSPEKNHYKVYKGGIYKDDLEKFIQDIKISIDENHKNFEKVYEEYHFKKNEEAKKIFKI